MKFTDPALAEDGTPINGQLQGARYVSECGGWKIIASDVHRPAASEWQVWQHIGESTPRALAGNWRRRLPWVRLPLPEHAQAVAEVLAALPMNASWAVAGVAVRDALRTVGAGVFFRGMHIANRAATSLSAHLRQRGEPPAEAPHG